MTDSRTRLHQARTLLWPLLGAALLAAAGCAARTKAPAPTAVEATVTPPVPALSVPSAEAPPQPPSEPAARASLAPPTPEALLGGNIPPQAGAAVRLVERARQQRSAGDSAGARETLERAIEIDPTCAFAYYDLAELHLEAGRPEQAAAFAEKAAVVGGSYGGEWLSHAQLLLGRAQQATGNTREAADSYRRALALYAGNVPARTALRQLQ